MAGNKVLYTSADVYESVQRLFSSSKGRRVAVTAFAGADAGDFLPNAEGVEVYCWPKAGSTSAEGVEDLQKRGAVVRFVDRLHSKIYWAEGRGAIVTSANLSRSAMGSKGLVESGVCLPDGVVDIDKLLRPLRPRKVTPSELAKLRRAAAVGRASRGGGLEPLTFTVWMASGAGRWKWSWFDEYQEDPVCKEAVAWARATYGVSDPEDTQFCRVGRVQPYDWLLVVELGKRSPIRNARWMYVNNVVKVSPKEKRLYDRRWPRQAVQAQSLRSCPTPPFDVDARFRWALRKAARAWGLKRVATEVDDRRPAPAFLRLIVKHWPLRW